MDIDQLQAQLAERDAQLATVTAERDAATAERDHSRVVADGAIARYRETVAASLPEPARALVAGDSIAAIDAAVEMARRIVTGLTAQQQTAPVPSGGAVRRPPDYSALSPAEKIRAGITEIHQRA
jgi:hypothetical protein